MIIIECDCLVNPNSWQFKCNCNKKAIRKGTFVEANSRAKTSTCKPGHKINHNFKRQIIGKLWRKRNLPPQIRWLKWNNMTLVKIL